MTGRRTRALCIVSIILLSVSGCAFTTATVDLNYTPEATRKSPLETVSPIRVAVKVEDQRAADEQDRVGVKKNMYGMVTAPVLSNSQVTQVIYDALKLELENNGHKIVSADAEEMNVTMSVHLTKYWSQPRIHFWDVEMLATVSSDIAIIRSRDKDTLCSKKITGTFRQSFQIADDSAYPVVLNGALGEFVRNFSLDPAILAGLREAAKGN